MVLPETNASCGAGEADHLARIHRDDRYLLVSYLSGAPFPPELLPLDVDRVAKLAYGSRWKPSLSSLMAAIQAVRAAHAEQLVLKLVQIPGLPRSMLELAVDEILISYSLTVAEVAALVTRLADSTAGDTPTKPVES